MDEKQLQDILNKNTKTSFIGDVLNDSWDETKKELGSYLGYLIISFIALIILSIALDQVSLIVGFDTSFIIQIITPLMTSGSLFYFKASQKGQASFTNFFDVFKRPKEFIIWGVISAIVDFILLRIPSFIFGATLFSGLVSPPDDFSMITDNLSNLISGVSIFFIIYLLINILFSLVVPVLVFNEKANTFQSLKISIHIVKNNFFSFLGYYIIMLGIIFISMLACGLGLLFTIPMSIIGVGFIYLKFFNDGKNYEESLIEDFGIEEEFED